MREDIVIARLRLGEQGAYGEVYEAHHAYVRRFARRIVPDDASVDDLLAETFRSLPSAIDRFRGDSSLRSFLVAIAASVNQRRAMTTTE